MVEILDTRCDQHGLPDEGDKPSAVAYVRWKGTRHWAWLCAACLEQHRDRIATKRTVLDGINACLKVLEKYNELPKVLTIKF